MSNVINYMSTSFNTVASYVKQECETFKNDVQTTHTYFQKWYKGEEIKKEDMLNIFIPSVFRLASSILMISNLTVGSLALYKIKAYPKTLTCLLILNIFGFVFGHEIRNIAQRGLNIMKIDDDYKIKLNEYHEKGDYNAYGKPIQPKPVEPVEPEELKDIGSFLTQDMWTQSLVLKVAKLFA